MIGFNIDLPKEILIIVFQHLCCCDLISCSRACWTWNDAANSLLYETVSLPTCSKFYEFIETVTNFEFHLGSFSENTINRHQEIGHLVKVVDIAADYSCTDENEVHRYSTNLSRLVSKTPNVHTSKLFLPVICTDTESNFSFDWSAVALQWSKLTNLTLRRPLAYDLEECDLNNINDVLNRLQHLDITPCDDIITYMPSLPSMPSLQSFMVNIIYANEIQALQKILQACQSTLHTLIMILHQSDRLFSVNLDDLMKGHEQLKAFGLTTERDSQVHITNFGDNLEHLEWWGSGWMEDTTECTVYQAMIKTSKLRTLSILGHDDVDHVALVLERNKNTLHTFYYGGMFVHHLIPLLQAKKVRLFNVITLCIESHFLEDSQLHSLAEIFPNVEFLALRRYRQEHENPRLTSSGSKCKSSVEKNDVKWIAMDSLSHFQHLKAIDEFAYLELIDQDLATYEKRIIIPFEYSKQPRVMPMFL